MAKAKKYWFGFDTYGRHVEVAMREDGEYFARWQEKHSKYGIVTVKWQTHIPTFDTKTVNAYSGEITEHPENPIMCWGSQRLERCDRAGLKLRLPNS